MERQRIGDYSIANAELDLSMLWEKRIENDGSGNPLYIGYNKEPNASTSTLGWFIIKNTYSGTFLTRSQLPDDGPQFKYAWDSRATYFT